MLIEPLSVVVLQPSSLTEEVIVKEDVTDIYNYCARRMEDNNHYTFVRSEVKFECECECGGSAAWSLFSGSSSVEYFISFMLDIILM